ncbi:hypothetical protein BH10PLA2_BH10PLA2_15380 [soil metagenome]
MWTGSAAEMYVNLPGQTYGVKERAANSQSRSRAYLDWVDRQATGQSEVEITPTPVTFRRSELIPLAEPKLSGEMISVFITLA